MVDGWRLQLPWRLRLPGTGHGLWSVADAGDQRKEKRGNLSAESCWQGEGQTRLGRCVLKERRL